MLITLSHCSAICQSVTEVLLTSVAPLGAVSHRYNFNLIYTYKFVCFFLWICTRVHACVPACVKASVNRWVFVCSCSFFQLGLPFITRGLLGDDGKD